MRHKLIRTNKGKTIHRAGCSRLAHAKQSWPWNWADERGAYEIRTAIIRFGYKQCAACKPLQVENCPHDTSREIAAPQHNVEDGRLIDLRLLFCLDCGEKWETREDLGEVDSITVAVTLKEPS